MPRARALSRVRPMTYPGPLKPYRPPVVPKPTVIRVRANDPKVEEAKFRFYEKGMFWKFVKDRYGAQLVSLYLVSTFLLFSLLECRDVIYDGTIGILIPVGAFLFGIITFCLMYAFIFVEPGAMPILEPDLQELEFRYMEKFHKNFDSPWEVLKDVNYYGKVVKGDYCFQCRRFKDMQTIHCKECGRCVARFDHHCYLFGTCIGLRNFKYFFWYQVFILLFSLYLLAFSIYRSLEMGVRYSVMVWVMGGMYLLLVFSGNFEIVLNPLVYTYLICKGRTAYESWYRFKLLYFKKEINDRVHNFVLEKYFKRGSCCKNLADFLCRRAPRSVLNDPPNVFDYESGDTESRSSSSSYSTSGSSATTLTPVDSLNGFPLHTKSGCPKCLQIFCKCCQKPRAPPVDPSTFVYSRESAIALGIPKFSNIR